MRAIGEAIMSRKEKRAARQKRHHIDRHWRNMLGYSSRSDLARPMANKVKRKLAPA